LPPPPSGPRGNPIAMQEAKVEIARKAWLDFARKHHIVETVHRNPRPDWDDPHKFQEMMEREIQKLTAQWEALRGREGDDLIAAMAELGVVLQLSSFTKGYPEYLAEITRLRRAAESGLGEDHPDIQSLHRSVETKREQLRSAAEHYQSSLAIQLKSAVAMLAN